MRALRYLLIQLVLQLLLRPGELSESAFELVICIGKDFGFQEVVDSSGDDGTEDSPNHWMFNITDDGLLRMLRIIKKDLKPSRHRSEESEDDDDDEVDLLDIEEEDSDVAELGEVGENDEHTDGETALIGAAGGSANPENSDESDDDMDDDAMFRMDSYLAKIFQEKKNQAGGDTALSQLNLFKLRVLSLLEIYLHENPGKSLFFVQIKCLFHCYHYCILVTV